jgi:anti-sigma factor RsiW
MECNNWQETGLMYLSGELNDKESSRFLEHMQACEVCRNEIASFEHLQTAVLSPDIFCAVPSGETDAKIIAACSRKPILTGINLLGAPWVKRTVYSSLFLLFGLGAGIYFAPYINTVMNRAPAETVSATFRQPAPAAQAHVQPATAAVRTDSLASHSKDSFNQPEQQMIARPIDASSQQGIITVDLKKE